jgi:hypothetical protein
MLATPTAHRNISVVKDIASRAIDVSLLIGLFASKAGLALFI